MSEVTSDAAVTVGTGLYLNNSFTRCSFAISHSFREEGAGDVALHDLSLDFRRRWLVIFTRVSL